MELYMMRHGQAVPEAENREQPLSRAGVVQIQSAAAAMKRMSITLDAIVCSTKRRSHQTAALVAEGVNYPYSDIFETEAVCPTATADEAMAVLRQFRESRRVLLTGHLPSLGEIASFLMTGGVGVNIAFENGGLLRLDLPGLPTTAAELVYLLTPEQMRLLAGKL